MVQKFVFVALLCFAAATSAAVVPKDMSTMASMNEIMDEVMANLRHLLISNGFESINLPNVGWNFSEKFFLITWHGEALIEEGFLKGMETIHRTGETDLTYTDEGAIKVLCDAGINAGTLGAKLTAQFMNLGPVARVSGTIKNIAVKLNLNMDLMNSKLELEKLDIKNLGLLTMKVDGLGFILDFLAEACVLIFGNLVKDIVALFLQGTIKDLLNEILAKLIVPANTIEAVRAHQGVQAAFVPVEARF